MTNRTETTALDRIKETLAALPMDEVCGEPGKDLRR